MNDVVRKADVAREEEKRIKAIVAEHFSEFPEPYIKPWPRAVRLALMILLVFVTDFACVSITRTVVKHISF